MSSSRDILNLKAITAEYADQLHKGKKPVRATKPQDPFDKPSPGLIKRLAAEARNDAKRRVFQDDAGPSSEERRAILERKAAQYEAIKRGDLSGLTEKQIAEGALDFDRLGGSGSDDDDDDDEDEVEYVDELGRTRTGTRAEAARHGQGRLAGPSAYEEVLQSTVIRGDQNFFPVYEPDPDALLRKHREAEIASRQAHYDTSKEGQYQFSLDETTRAQQMAELREARLETERARAEAQSRASRLEESRKRKLDERQAILEAKRVQRFGGADKLARLRAEKEAEDLLRDVQAGLM